MYCRRCDKDDVGAFHRCFVNSRPAVRPLKQRPNPNTPLARKLAKIYESECGEKFPGGIDNAKIVREQMGMSEAWRHHGSWVWTLAAIDGAHICEFGSQRTAKECGETGKVLMGDSNG